jgi:isocitrate dehydrogenase
MQAIKFSQGFIWAMKNYNGDVQSDIPAQGFSSLETMALELISVITPDIESEALHGTAR